uniref:IF rod domain-containing protein n=1 Tax=Pelusios castaneus TaxID=367368 RepID=A0A8C8VKH8_9SAUR
MSRDPHGLARPRQEFRSVRSTKSTVSSSLYGLHRPALPPALEKLDLSQVSGLNAELLGLRAREKEQLGRLNDRFAAYTETVRQLELRNAALRGQLEALRQRHQDPPRLHLLYRQELRGLRGLLQAEADEKRRLEAGREQLRRARSQLEGRSEEAARLRLRAEETLRAVREEAGRAALAVSRVEGSLGSLLAEIAFLRELFGAESAALAAQLRAAGGGPAQALAGAAKPDLAAALREIRAQYEHLAARNRRAAEDWYRARFAAAAELAGRDSEAARSVREETAEYRLLLQSRSAELEALRGVIEALNRQLQSPEVAGLGLGLARQEMAQHLCEYRDLLSVKMALDMEIAAYRKQSSWGHTDRTPPPPALSDLLGLVSSSPFPAPVRGKALGRDQQCPGLQLFPHCTRLPMHRPCPVVSRGPGLPSSLAPQRHAPGAVAWGGCSGSLSCLLHK